MALADGLSMPLEPHRSHHLFWRGFKMDDQRVSCGRKKSWAAKLNHFLGGKLEVSALKVTIPETGEANGFPSIKLHFFFFLNTGI